MKLISAVQPNSGISEPSISGAMQVSKGTSYITGISILGSVVALLFLVKWVYVSRRQNNPHKGSHGTSRFVWRDEFSASSLPLWGDNSSHSKKYVRSALLVGLLGSPSWETRYSAIVDKVSGSRTTSHQGSLLPIESPRRYTIISADSDQNARMHSPIRKCRAASLHLPDGHGLTALFKPDKTRPPSPAMGSGMKRSRYSENMAHIQDLDEWRTEIMSGKHTSYPSGLCIARHSGLDPLETRIPIGFLPSIFSSTKDPLESHASLTVRRETSSCDFPQSWNRAGTSAESLDPAECCMMPRIVITEGDFRNIESNKTRNDLEGLLINGSSWRQKNASLDSSHVPEIISAWDLDEPEKSVSVHSGEIFGVSHVDIHHGAEFPFITPIKSRVRISSTRERVRSRSPRVGPSPLRRMFLPSDESTEKANHSIRPSLISQENCEDSRQWRYKHGDNDQSSAISFNSLLDTEQGQATDPGFFSSRPAEESSTLKRSQTAKEKKADGNLLGLLEELVQETSEWDADMFIDNNFKAMIDNSKSFDVCTPKAQRKKSTQLRRRRVSFIYLEDIPEVDIGEFSPPHADEDDCSYWSDEDDVHRAVGIAR